MAGQEWRDWFEREELIGQISDIRVQNLQVEREVVQKRTFTRWMNLHLEKCNPPLVVQDLFRDIRDGRVLMALLEELSGCRLLHEFKPSAHRIFRLNNIARVLTFLEERNVKLVSIDAADVADGNSSIVLGLIWNIILFFQIKELTGNIRNQFPSSSSLSSIPNSSDSDISQSSTPSDDRKPSAVPRDHGRAIKTLLHWVQRRTRKYGVAVHDFGKSWVSGMAFLAVIKSIDPSLVDMRRALLRSPRENIEEAFRTAHYSLGIPRLLEPEDVTLNHPDQQSIMTYVSQFLEHFPGIEEDEPSDFLERNKVSVRSTEPVVRNGVQRKREKCSVVKREWVQPPPKIFISSVIEDQTRKRPPVRARTMEDRPWDSEDSSVGSSPSTTESRPLCRALSLNKEVCSDSSSTQPSLMDSAMDSAVDSTVDSADSWAETPSEFQPSCSTDSFGDVSSPAELTSLGSPLDSDRVLKDVEMLIDEGNFSLSLDARSTLLSEEEEAFRYILDLKEDESVSVNVETSTSNLEESALCASSGGDGDSGYFPGHTDSASLAMQPEEVLKLLPITEHDPKCYSDVTAEPKTECSNVASESPVSGAELASPFDDDAEYHVVQYERISISGSEEDVEEHCSRLDEQPLEMSAGFSCDPLEEHACRHPSLKEIEDIDQILQDPDELLLESEPEDRDTFLPLVELSQISEDSRCSGSLWSKDEVQGDHTDQVYSELGLESLEPTIQSAVKTSEADVEVELSQASNLEPEIMNQSFLEPSSQLIIQNTESETHGDDLTCSESELSQSCTMTEDSKMEGTRTKVGEDQDVRFQIQDHQVSDELVSEPEVKDAQQDLICPELGSPQILTQTQTEDPEILAEILKDPLDQMDPVLNFLPISNETSLYEVEESKPEIRDQRRSIGQDDAQVVRTTSGIQCSDMFEEQMIQPDESNPETTACAEPGISEGSADRPSEDFVCADGPSEETFPEVSDVSHNELEDGSNKLTPESNETNNDNEMKAELILKLETPFNQHEIQELEIPAVPQHDPEPIATTQLNPAEEENMPIISSTSSMEKSHNLKNEDHAALEDWISNRGVDRTERYREENRRSLSVTPLQPAPSQPCNSDSDSEHPSQDKVDEGSVESPMQSPFGLWVSHPGEWGVVEPDHLDVSELNSRNEKLDAIAAPAAEKPVAPRTEEKETVAKNIEDKIQPQPPVRQTPNTQDEPREQPKEEPKKAAKEEPRKEAIKEPRQEAMDKTKEEVKEKPKEEPKVKTKDEVKEEPRKELKEEPKEKPKEEPKKEAKEKPELKKEAKEKPEEELKKEAQKELKREQKEEPQKELNRELKEQQAQKEPRGRPAATTADPKPDESSVCVMCNRKVNCCTQNREPSRQTVFSELDLLLLLWLLVFCLLVLPQMDVWSLPALLLNTDK